ncbi:MAG: c-type cytochrome [Rhodospirillales bacterium]|jgi:cytochrome c|nr:c-type cytochrome [Rhodospirillales bacterium]
MKIGSRCALAAALALAFAGAAQAQMPAGDAAKGQDVFKKCTACHAVEAGKHKVGPSLHGVVGRQAGSTDFARYVGLKGTDIVWTEENLFEYLADPTAFVKSKTQNPRSGMAYKLPKPEERADVIAYLKTLTN